MKIIIFGATGMVGKQLVQQALFKNYQVKAFGRNVFTELDADNPNLELIKGALFDETQVQDAIKGCDAVLSSLGGDFLGNDKTRTLGIKNIITQMKKNNVTRIIAVGGMGILNADEHTLLIDQKDYPQEYLPVGNEHLQAYHYLVESQLDWTFVCPPNILNTPATGLFFLNANYPPQINNNKISAGDLALFMVNELVQNKFIKQRVGISN